MKRDLRAMLGAVGSQKKSDIVAALKERVYSIARKSKHEIWSNGEGSIIPVPRTLKGVGTVRRILELLIDAEESEENNG
jgi:hypothetical protein